MAKMTGFSDLSDRRGFLVVYPNGTGPLRKERLLTWNAGNCCGFALDHELNDAAFLRRLVGKLQAERRVDPRRVFAAGFSNGAGMVYRAACEMSDILAGIAPVSGALSYEGCAPKARVSVIAFNGTADKHVPYSGGRPERQLDRRHPRIDRPVSFAISFWKERDGCPARAERTQSGSIVRESYGPCRGGTAVELVTIQGGGHAWPGGEKWATWADEPTREISANDAMWEFFAAHPKQEPAIP
jgi:polyhydroxybutyrate depolymerase